MEHFKDVIDEITKAQTAGLKVVPVKFPVRFTLVLSRLMFLELICDWHYDTLSPKGSPIYDKKKRCSFYIIHVYVKTM